MRISFYDVFAGRPFSGNQAAVVRATDGAWSDAQLLTLARELLLAETALVSREDDVLVCRFANTDRVIDRCGHATLACVADHVLSLGSPPSKASGSYRVGASIARWEAEMQAGGPDLAGQEGLLISVEWPDRPHKVRELDRPLLYSCFGIVDDARTGALPCCVYSSGNLNALVPVSSREQLEKAQPDWQRFGPTFHALGLTDLHLYCVETVEPGRQRALCRNVFPYGLFEEAATGTASVALAAALLDCDPAIGRAGSAEFQFEQGTGQRRGTIAVDWARTGTRETFALKGRVFPIIEGRLLAKP